MIFSESAPGFFKFVDSQSLPEYVSSYVSSSDWVVQAGSHWGAGQHRSIRFSPSNKGRPSSFNHTARAPPPPPGGGWSKVLYGAPRNLTEHGVFGLGLLKEGRGFVMGGGGC